MELSGQGWDAGVLSMWLACGAWELGEMRTRERRAQALGLSAFGGLGEEAWPLTTCGLGKAGGGVGVVSGSGSGQRHPGGQRVFVDVARRMPW